MLREALRIELVRSAFKKRKTHDNDCRIWRKKVKYLGFDDIESLDEAISCGGIDMRQGDQWVYMDVDGWGYRVYEHDVDRPYMDNHYPTLQEMIDNYVFPDGTPLKGLVDGTIPETGDEQTNIE